MQFKICESLGSTKCDARIRAFATKPVDGPTLQDVPGVVKRRLGRAFGRLAHDGGIGMLRLLASDTLRSSAHPCGDVESIEHREGVDRLVPRWRERPNRRFGDRGAVGLGSWFPVSIARQARGGWAGPAGQRSGRGPYSIC